MDQDFIKNLAPHSRGALSANTPNARFSPSYEGIKAGKLTGWGEVRDR